MVIEVDIELSYFFCKGNIFKVLFKGFDCGKKECEVIVYIRYGL